MKNLSAKILYYFSRNLKILNDRFNDICDLTYSKLILYLYEIFVIYLASSNSLGKESK